MASKTTPALIQSRQWGRIEVFPSAVAAIAGHAAMRCYGISGTAGRGLRDGFAELLRRENADKGVDVVQVEDGLAIDVYVIVQYGIRISEVAHNLQETVKFEVERSVNVPVISVPSEPRFEYQQSPWLPGNSSHQKSTPLGAGLPSAVRPMLLS